jgi:hypothetical protein
MTCPSCGHALADDIEDGFICANQQCPDYLKTTVCVVDDEERD